MAGKKRFIDGYVLQSDDALLAGEVNNPVNQQKREAMRQDAQDVVDVQRSFGRGLSL